VCRTVLQPYEWSRAWKRLGPGTEYYSAQHHEKPSLEAIRVTLGTYHYLVKDDDTLQKLVTVPMADGTVL
jgi:hypothetical protein